MANNDAEPNMRSLEPDYERIEVALEGPALVGRIELTERGRKVAACFFAFAAVRSDPYELFAWFTGDWTDTDCNVPGLAPWFEAMPDWWLGYALLCVMDEPMCEGWFPKDRTDFLEAFDFDCLLDAHRSDPCEPLCWWRQPTTKKAEQLRRKAVAAAMRFEGQPALQLYRQHQKLESEGSGRWHDNLDPAEDEEKRRREILVNQKGRNLTDDEQRELNIEVAAEYGIPVPPELPAAVTAHTRRLRRRF